MNKQFRNFSIYKAIFTLAFAIGKIFGVLNFYLIFDRSLVAAIGIYASSGLITAFCSSQFARYYGKIGTRNSLIISTIIFVLSYLILIPLDSGNKLVLAGLWVIIYGLARSMFYPSFHYYIFNFTRLGTRGYKLGLLEAMTEFVSILTPVIGSILSDLSGISAVAIGSCVIFLIAIIPLINLPNTHFKYTGNLLNMLKFRDFRQNIFMSLLNELQNRELFWQIYVFIMVGSNFLNLGYLLTVIAIISVLFRVVFGKFIDTRNKKRIFQLDGLITSFSWLLRITAYTPLRIAVSDIIYNFNSKIKDAVGSYLSYDLIQKKNMDNIIDEKIINREIILNLLFFAVNVVFLLITHFFGLQAVFILAAYASLLFLIF